MERMSEGMATQKKGSVFLIGELPSAMVVEILSRLPICSLLRCKCVCKTWRDIVSDPFFARKQLATASASVTRSRTNVMVLSLPEDRRNVELFELEPNHHDYTQTPPLQSMRFKTKLRLPRQKPSKIAVVGSCNGLLCLHRWPSRVYLCNPILGEYVSLPPLQPQTYFTKCEFYMLGFSGVTGQYKILRFLEILDRPSPFPDTAQVEVLTLGNSMSTVETWRSLGDAPYPINFFPHNYYDLNSFGKTEKWIWDGHGSNVTLNGALHWLSTREGNAYGITCFDIDTEQFHPFPHPSELDGYEGRMMWLKVLQNCLCFVGDDPLGVFLIVWSMKEYGVAQSWTRLYTLKTASFPASLPYAILSAYFHPFTLWKDGGQLISAAASTSGQSNCLVSYDLNQNRVCKFNIYGMGFGIAIPIDFTPSLLSLKDIAAPHSVKIQL